MQKLFTAKLDEEDFDRLRDIAAGRPLVEVLRGWIRDGGTAVYTGAEATQATLPAAAGPWKSAEAFIAAPAVRDVHQACKEAEGRAEVRLAQAMALYGDLLGTLDSIVADTAKQRDARTFIVGEALILRARALVEEAHSLTAEVRRLDPSFDPSSPF